MPIRYTVTKKFGLFRMTDEQVFFVLEKQFKAGGCAIKISFRAKEKQIDKAMEVLMKRAARAEVGDVERKMFDSFKVHEVRPSHHRHDSMPWMR